MNVFKKEEKKIILFARQMWYREDKKKQLEMILLLLVKNCLKIMQFTNIIIVFEFDKMFVKKYVLYLPNVRTTIKYAFALKLTAFNIIVTFVWHFRKKTKNLLFQLTTFFSCPHILCVYRERSRFFLILSKHDVDFYNFFLTNLVHIWHEYEYSKIGSIASNLMR